MAHALDVGGRTLPCLGFLLADRMGAAASDALGGALGWPSRTHESLQFPKGQRSRLHGSAGLDPEVWGMQAAARLAPFSQQSPNPTSAKETPQGWVADDLQPRIQSLTKYYEGHNMMTGGASVSRGLQSYSMLE